MKIQEFQLLNDVIFMVDYGDKTSTVKIQGFLKYFTSEILIKDLSKNDEIIDNMQSSNLDDSSTNVVVNCVMGHLDHNQSNNICSAIRASKEMRIIIIHLL